MWLLGLDPGGDGRFGWCVAEARDGSRPSVRGLGVTSDARAAITSALRALPRPDALVGAGIDSPLFWSHAGDRNADRLIRRQIRKLGARAPAGTVQHVNSLRGACLVQGVLAAHLLRKATPSVRITEAHPKALLWLIGAASAVRSVRSISLAEVRAFIESETDRLSEHERDAALAAASAWAMMVAPHGWRDLALDEPEPFVPVPPVEYWMPEPSRPGAEAPEVARL